MMCHKYMDLCTIRPVQKYLVGLIFDFDDLVSVPSSCFVECFGNYSLKNDAM